MSLINDALKRAKAAQEQGPLAPAPGPLLRPVEPQPGKWHGLGFFLPVVVALAALIGLACLWSVLRRSTARGPATVAARGNFADLGRQAQAASPQPPPTDPTDRTDRSSGALPDTAPATSTPALSAAAPAPPASPETNTNPAALPEPPPPKPAPLRLQAILFHPTRPSVMIGGKMLSIGGTVGEFRVLAIGRTSATLASATQTNILTLPE